jgi:hypothetical protein
MNIESQICPQELIVTKQSITSHVRAIVAMIRRIAQWQIIAMNKITKN